MYFCTMIVFVDPDIPKWQRKFAICAIVFLCIFGFLAISFAFYMVVSSLLY